VPAAHSGQTGREKPPVNIPAAMRRGTRGSITDLMRVTNKRGKVSSACSMWSNDETLDASRPAAATCTHGMLSLCEGELPQSWRRHLLVPA
jgi:hypothetical protein